MQGRSSERTLTGSCGRVRSRRQKYPSLYSSRSMFSNGEGDELIAALNATTVKLLALTHRLPDLTNGGDAF